MSDDQLVVSHRIARLTCGERVVPIGRIDACTRTNSGSLGLHDCQTDRGYVERLNKRRRGPHRRIADLVGRHFVAAEGGNMTAADAPALTVFTATITKFADGNWISAIGPLPAVI